MTDTCGRCGQITLGGVEYQHLRLSLNGSAWNATVTLCPGCLEDVCAELPIEAPPEVVVK